jgi:hypothetical protein
MIEKRSGAASCKTPSGIFVTGGDKGQGNYLSSPSTFLGSGPKDLTCQLQWLVTAKFIPSQEL